jgi:hypothetical protein
MKGCILQRELKQMEAMLRAKVKIIFKSEIFLKFFLLHIGKNKIKL